MEYKGVEMYVCLYSSIETGTTNEGLEDYLSLIERSLMIDEFIEVQKSKRRGGKERSRKFTYLCTNKVLFTICNDSKFLICTLST